MADVVLTVTIPDANVARAKELIEYEYFGGNVQTAADIRTFVEGQLRDNLLAKLKKIAASKAEHDLPTEIILT